MIEEFRKMWNIARKSHGNDNTQDILTVPNDKTDKVATFVNTISNNIVKK